MLTFRAASYGSRPELTAAGASPARPDRESILATTLCRSLP